MENRYINRYRSFCASLKNLQKSRTADPSVDFVLEGTMANFNLTFDISWKVMKDILIKQLGILDFATGSPRETLQQAFTNAIISDDSWMQMLRVRNQLAHDYDGSFARQQFHIIVNQYLPLFEQLEKDVRKYYQDGTDEHVPKYLL